MILQICVGVVYGISRQRNTLVFKNEQTFSLQCLALGLRLSCVEVANVMHLGEQLYNTLHWSCVLGT